MVKIKAEIRMIVEADSMHAILCFVGYNKRAGEHRYPPKGVQGMGGALETLKVKEISVKTISGEDQRTRKCKTGNITK